MQPRILVALLAIGIGAWAVLPPASHGQFKFKGGGFGPPGGGFGPPGGGFGPPGGGFGTRDPNQIFDFLSKGRGYFLISESRSKELLTKFAQEKGIADGRITRDLYLSYNQWLQAQANGGSRPPFGPGAPQSPMGPAAPAPQGTPAAGPSEALVSWAESEFKRRDRNNDGFLNRDEMSDSLRNNAGRWDTNRDNLINLEEYKAYFAARFQGGRRGDDGPANSVAIIIEEEELDRLPVVFRAGKLPKELPAWFQELDADKDGQVGLYEWRKGSKNIEEFPGWDRNDDGFLTAEEVLFRQKNAQVASAGAPNSSGPSLAPKPPADDKSKGGGMKGLFSGFKFKRPQ